MDVILVGVLDFGADNGRMFESFGDLAAWLSIADFTETSHRQPLPSTVAGTRGSAFRSAALACEEPGRDAEHNSKFVKIFQNLSRS